MTLRALLKIIVNDVVTIATIGPQYLALRALHSVLVRREQCRHRKPKVFN